MNNPPAFPHSLSCEHEKGMTLRDYFAAKALQGMIAGTANPQAMGYPKTDESANKAYQYADAMLSERTKQ